SFYCRFAPAERLFNALLADEVPNARLGVAVLDEGDVAGRVLRAISEADVAGDAIVADAGQGGQDGGRVGAASSLDGFERNVVGVIAHDGDGRYHVVAAVVLKVDAVGVDPLLERRVELGVAALLIEGGDVDMHVVLALGGFHDDVGVPGVAREDGHAQILSGGLVDDQSSGLSGDRSHEDVAAVGLGVGDVAAVVGGALLEDLLDAVLSAEGLDEVVHQADGVVVALLGEAVGLGRAEALGIVRQDGALEGVDEADAVICIADLGDLRVSAGDADGGHARVAEGGGSRYGHAGAVGAEHNGAALLDEFQSRGDGLAVAGLVVGVDELDVVGIAADRDGLGQGVGILHAEYLLLAARAVVAGLGLKHA